ncbi:MAG: rhodanese-like domain-containing protein [Planctomycetota bacterium]
MVGLSHWMIQRINWTSPFFFRSRVETISTESLAHRLSDPSDESFVLVDVRSVSEYSVSRIPGAISKREFIDQRAQLHSKQVIAYCTVGGRSLWFAQTCAKMGFDSINYLGSILQWCAAGHELIGPDGEVTDRVHTHNRLFRAPRGYVRTNTQMK